MDNNKKIQVAAYYLWQNNGCPEGRSEEFWYKAVSQLAQAPKAPAKKGATKKKASSFKKTTYK